MRVLDYFNVHSAAGHITVGAVNVALGSVNLAQAALSNGGSQYLQLGIGGLAAVAGANLAFLGLQKVFRSLASRKAPRQGPVSSQHNSLALPALQSQPVASPRLASLRLKRRERAAEGMAALTFTGLASQLPPQAGGRVVMIATGAYAAGCAIGVGINTAQIWLANRAALATSQPNNPR